jgi:hypothetical protein
MRVNLFWLKTSANDPTAAPTVVGRLKKIGIGPLFLSLLFVFLYLLADRSGLDFPYPPWRSDKILDVELLMEDPVVSIWHFHARPPLYNTMLAVLLRVDKLLPISIQHMHQFLYFLFAWCSVLLMYGAFRRMTGSARWGTLFAVCSALNPMLYRLCFHPGSTLLVHVAFSLVLYMTVRFSRSRSLRDYLWLGASVFLLSWTRAAYHPLFCFLYLGGLTGILWWTYRPEWNRVELIVRTCVIAALVLVWPVKNALLFGVFTNSTWLGYNFARNTPVRLEFHQRMADIAVFQEMGEGLHPSLSQVVKSEAAGGTRNWNHIWFPRTSSEFQKKSMEVRRQNKSMYFKWALCQYFMTTPSCFYQAYDGVPQLYDMLDPGFYRWFVHSYERVLFPDLRPAVGPLFFGEVFMRLKVGERTDNVTERTFTVDEFVDVMGTLSGTYLLPLRTTAYGVLVLPSFLLVTAVFLMIRIRRLDELDGIAAVGVFTLLWVLFTTVVSDGIEGSRMRYGTTGINLVLLWYIGLRISGLLQNRKRSLAFQGRA